MRRIFGLCLVVVALVVWEVHGRGQDNLDSLVVCRDTQKLLFENSFVRVINDVIPPGVSEPRHHHPHGVVIALETADTEVRVLPGGVPTRRHTLKDTVTWNEDLVHEVKNVGSTPTHFIRIDLK